MRFHERILPVILVILAITACDRGDQKILAGPGVDVQNRILYVGSLNDESGPAAALGRPYALGTRLLVHQINAGESDILPEGWRVRLVERDHGYDPQTSLQHFQAMQDRVLFFISVFGTPNILPLLDHLEREEVVAFPTSLSSTMAQNPYTPPLGAPYRVEAMRGMAWLVDERYAQREEPPRTAIIYQDDDYGEDSLSGWRQAADFHDVEVAAEIAVTPDTDMTGAIAGLDQAGVDAVLLATLPTTTLRVVKTADAMDYRPLWLGNTPAWTDRFVDPAIGGPELFENFRMLQSFPYWTEDTEFVREFTAALEAYTDGRVTPSNYTIGAYIRAAVAFKAFSLAVEAGDVTRPGYLRALQSIHDFDADGGLHKPLDMTVFPYLPGVQVRVLRPLTEIHHREQVADFARPRSLQ